MNYRVRNSQTNYRVFVRKRTPDGYEYFHTKLPFVPNVGMKMIFWNGQLESWKVVDVEAFFLYDEFNSICIELEREE